MLMLGAVRTFIFCSTSYFTFLSFYAPTFSFGCLQALTCRVFNDIFTARRRFPTFVRIEDFFLFDASVGQQHAAHLVLLAFDMTRFPCWSKIGSGSRMRHRRGAAYDLPYNVLERVLLAT